MASTMYGPTAPECVDGPHVKDGTSSWDRVDATFLCPGSRAQRGGFAPNQLFPGFTGVIIESIATQPAGPGCCLVSLSGRGAAKQRVYCARNSYASSEKHSDIEVGGVPYSAYNPAWPSVDLLLNGEGFRQHIVGATSIIGDVGARVAAPQVGSFPVPPQNPWSEIDSPNLNYPWGWCIVRRDAEPLLEGAYSQAGPWILTTEYEFRWKITPA